MGSESHLDNSSSASNFIGLTVVAVLCASLFWAGPASAQTPVSGSITTDTTWTLAGSPYQVTGNITVAGTDGPDSITTLTIEPGVQVQVGSGWKITFGSSSNPGALQADGTAGGGPATIVFTSIAASPAPGDWQGLFFSTAARPSLLRKVNVEYAGKYSNAAIYLSHAAGVLMTLEDVEVSYSQNWGIRQHNDAAMTDIRVHDNLLEGIYLYGGPFSIDGCQAQGNGSHGIRLRAAASLNGSIENCTAIDSVYYESDAPAVTWAGNTFTNWGARVSRLEPEVAGSFAGANTVIPVASPEVELTTGTVVTDAEWVSALGETWTLLGLTTIQGTDDSIVADGITTVTIDPGLRFEAASNAGLQVGGNLASSPGALVADGDAGGSPATIVFTSTSASPTPGSWRGIFFRGGARPSLLRNVIVEYGGQFSTYNINLGQTAGQVMTLTDVESRFSSRAGIYHAGDSIISGLYAHDNGTYGLQLAKGAITLSDCTIEVNTLHSIFLNNTTSLTGAVQNCPAIDSVYYNGDGPSLAWSGNTFTDWGALVSRLEPDVAGEFGTDNTLSPVSGAKVELTSGIVARDAQWLPAVGETWVLMSSPLVYGSDGANGITDLTIAPGLRFEAAGNISLTIGGGTIGQYGSLTADGDAGGGSATIIFTSNASSPAPGDWIGIRFNTQSRSSLVRNVLVEYAGWGGLPALNLLQVAGDTSTLQDVEVRLSAGEGVQVNQGDFTLTGLNSHDNGEDGLRLAGGNVDVANCALESNGGHGVRVSNTGAMTGSVHNCAPINSVYYEGYLPEIDWYENIFDGWGVPTSRVPADIAGAFSVDNVFIKVPGAVLEIIPENITLDAVWAPDPGPFKVTSAATMVIQGTHGPDGRTTLQMAPGLAVLFPAASGLAIGGSSGDPGQLLIEGVAGQNVNLNTSNPAPAAGDWSGVDVRTTGRVATAHTQILNSTYGLRVSNGTLGPVDTLTVNRASTCLDLIGATVETDLHRLDLRNCDIGLKTAGTSLVVRNSNLLGTTWGVQNLDPATHCIDATDNWWGAVAGPSGSPPVVGCETETPAGPGAAITEGVIFAPYLDAPDDDSDGVDKDDGDGFSDPCTGGNTVDCDDNCPLVGNPSQADQDGDGVGDACDSNPVLRVSSDPADGADFAIIQEAVDAAFQSGTRIEIFPGLSPYFESVQVDRLQVFKFAGLDTGGGPVVVDGSAGPAFRLVNKVGTAPMRLHQMILSGFQGVRTSVDTVLADLAFTNIGTEAVQVEAGETSLHRVTVAPGTPVGVRIAAGASGLIRRTEMLGLVDAGIVAAGMADVENTLICEGTGADGIRLASTGALAMRFSTVAGNTGIGIDNSQSAGQVDVDRSILHGNSSDDLLNVPCAGLTWSAVGFPDCSAVNANLATDPMLDTAFHLQTGSPCLEHGPPPELFTGLPTTDLAGGPRLRDHDGDGLAISDCGAYEESQPAPAAGEVLNLHWDSDILLLWDATTGAAEYHIYRFDVATLNYANFGVCRDDLDTGRTDTQLQDLSEPLTAGTIFAYLVTAESSGGEEGTLGFAHAAERSNFTPCP